MIELLYAISIWCVVGLVVNVLLANDWTKHWPDWVHVTINILGGPLVWIIGFCAWLDYTIDNCRHNRRMK